MSENKCDNCGKIFKEKHHLSQHHKRKTPCTEKFQCHKCHTYFEKHYLLVRHLSRKTSCAPEEIPVITDNNTENRCLYCNKTFATKSNLTRHQKTCDKESNLLHIMDLVEKKVEQGISKGLSKFKTDKTNTPIININNNCLYVGNSPCIYGEEDPALLDINRMQTVLLNDPENFVKTVIQEYHNNPNLPQYHNVYYDVKKSQGMIFTRVLINGIMVSTWQKKDFKEISQDLVVKAKRYSTCVPLANGIKPKSIQEQRYDQGMKYVKEYTHTDEDLEKNKELLTELTNNSGFFKMIEDTTYISGMLPLIPLN